MPCSMPPVSWCWCDSCSPRYCRRWTAIVPRLVHTSKTVSKEELRMSHRQDIPLIDTPSISTTMYQTAQILYYCNKPSCRLLVLNAPSVSLSFIVSLAHSQRLALWIEVYVGIVPELINRLYLKTGASRPQLT